MTGSGAAAGATEIGELRIELRSVNGRGLQVKTRLGPACAGLEAAIEDVLRQRLHRGTVTITIDRVGAGSPFGDRAAMAQLLQELRDLAAALSLRDDLGLRDLVALAGTARTGEAAGQRELPPQLAAMLARAVDELLARRRAEGATTVAAMQQHLGELADLRLQAQAQAPALVENYRDKLLKRVNDFLAEQGLHLQPADVVREVALFADRVDVSEELQRLGAHLDEVQALLRQGGELGRRLDFMLQELLREANTLGSKSPDVALAHIVVGMKSRIDKLKEQAANLE